MIDLRTSRRDYFLHCAYWNQLEEDYIPNNEIVHLKEPDGFFSAKEVNTYRITSQVISGLFMAEQVNVTIETRDDVHNLKRNDLVSVDEKIYRVEDIQEAPVKKQRQFGKINYSKSYVITLQG